jgi:type IV pilus assembly protein PilM
MLHKLRRLLEEPPPEYVFEFSDAGIAWAHRAKSRQSGFHPLEPGVIGVSPVRDNVLQPEKVEEAIQRLAPPVQNKRQRPAAVILPDYSARVAVLDFDTFPGDPKEQMALVRFRVKKSVPFDLEAASVSFHVQPHPAGGKKRDVVVAVASLEILARYEAPLRGAGLQPGMVTLSALAMLNLVQSHALDVVAKICGNILTVAVTENMALRMFRCVEIGQVAVEDITSVLFPTFAYVEDELKRKPERLLLCGFGPLGEAIAPDLGVELNTRVEHLRSPYGQPGPHNAGLLGYLQGMGMEVAA